MIDTGNQPEDAAQVKKSSTGNTQELRRQRRILIGAIIAAILLVAFLVASLIFLLSPGTDTARIRDIFIIFMALETIFLGFVLVVLIIQLARLINLLQNEIKPILDSTNETVNTLRGTTTFLSDNLVEPIIKMNEYFSGIVQGLAVLGLYRKRSNKP